MMEREETLYELSNYLGESLSVYAPGYVDLKTIIALLKKPGIKTSFRLFLLNSDETVNKEIPREDIIFNSGNFTENYQNGQRKNLNISLDNSSGKYTPSINSLWISTKFRLDIGIESSFYMNTYWFPRGIYVLGNPNATRALSDKQISLTLLDKFAYLEGKVGTLEATYEIPVGIEIKKAIEGILTLDNGSGYPIDLKPIIYDPTFEGRTMPYTLKKDAGSNLADLILDIGTILNAEVFYNSMGNLCFININDTSNDIEKPVLWDYSDDESEYFQSSVGYDFENTINAVFVVGDNINNALYSASAVNNNPKSTICVQSIGRRIEYINDSNIYSDTLAQSRANYELRKRGIISTAINMQVSFNPLLFVNNLITVTDNFFKYKRQKFLIQSLSYNLGTDNQFNLSCSNLTNFEFNIESSLQHVPCENQTQGEGLIINWFGGNIPSEFILSFILQTESYFKYSLTNTETSEIKMYFEVSKSDSTIKTIYE